MKDKAKYASVYKHINLPNKKHLNFGYEVFNRNSMNNFKWKYVTQNIQKLSNQLLKSIEGQIQIFQNAEDYKFKFPDSKFPEVPEGQRNQITYGQKIESFEEDTFNPKLSKVQINQMRQNATFEVKSRLRNATIPYVWKVNDWLLRGRVNIINIWENGLAWIYSFFVNAITNFKTVIPESLGKIVKLPSQFFQLIFGKKSLRSLYIPNYQREVQKDFWTNIIENQLKDWKNQIGHEFLQLLYLEYQPAIYEKVDGTGKTKEEIGYLERIRQQKIAQYTSKKKKIDQFKEKLQKIQTKFESNWIKIRKRVLMQASNSIQQKNDRSMIEIDEQPILESNKDQAIIDKFHEQKFLIYTAHIKEHLPKQSIAPQILSSLVTLITLINIIQGKFAKKAERLAEIEKNTRQSIKKKYTIRSKDHRFMDDQMKLLYNPVKNKIQDEFYKSLFEDKSISQHLNQPYQIIYKKYLIFKKDKEKLVAQKKATLKCFYEPTRIFWSTYMLLPPYKIVNQRLVKQRQMSIDTSTDFWKFKLYAMRMKSWTINCAVFLIAFAWVGPFGLRCLFGIKDFVYDEQMNYSDDTKYYHYQQTVIGTFLKVLQGINSSRQHFENLPDRGLFGKNFSRIFNYIQCYVFRLILVGIIGVLIIYPILIIVLSLSCFVLMLTIWIWVPLVMILTYLFNILVFQFQTSTIPSGVFIRSVPLLSLAILILVCLVKSIFALLFLVLITPLVSLFYSLFLVLQRGWRTFTDSIMVIIIGKLGRTPSRDTAIAKKISGPRMSRSYFFSIYEDDVYILTQSALQKIFMEKLYQLTRIQIQSHGQKYQQIVKYVLKPYGYTGPSLNYESNIVPRNKQFLQKNFDNRYDQYLARYPNHPTRIRFTQEEIDIYFENCVKIVKKFVQKEQIKQWIFDEKKILYEDYDQLTRLIWIEIFNCGQQIFEPLEKIDSRFKLEDEEDSNHKLMRKKVHSVRQALEGEIQLSTSKANFNPAKRSLLQKDKQIKNIDLLFSIHNSNSQTRLNLQCHNTISLFVPPRNLNELKAYDQYRKNEYENTKNRYKIIKQDINLQIN